MNTIQLKCFLEAGQCGSFTTAASTLFLTQPALSHNIAVLEEEWGVTLFERDRKKKDTKLTPAGKYLYEHMIEFNTQLEKTVEYARLMDQGKTGQIRLGVLAGDIINDKTKQILQDFWQAYPEIEVKIKVGGYSSLVTDLKQNRLDCIITLEVLVTGDPEISYIPIFTANSFLILPEKNPLAKREFLTFADCRDQTFLIVSESDSPIIFDKLQRGCRRGGFEPKMIQLPDLHTQMLYLEAGLGIVIGNEFNRCLQMKGFVGIKLPGLQPHNFVLARNKTYNPCVTRLFQQFSALSD